VAEALAQALLDHELVKVKVGTSSTDDRHQAAEALAKQVGAHNVAVVGKVLILYKAHPENPVIKLPKK